MATEVISGRDIEYRIIADKGVVVCKLYNCSDIAIRRIEKYTKRTIYTDKYCISDIYTGIARCAEEDTFDVSIGMEIALNKAKRKRAKAINNAIREYVDDDNKRIARLLNYGIHELPVIKEH